MHRTLEQVLQDIDEEMKKEQTAVMKKLLKDTRFAMNSRDLSLVHEQIGAYQMALFVKAIDRKQADFFRQVLIYDGLNNYALIKLH